MPNINLNFVVYSAADLNLPRSKGKSTLASGSLVNEANPKLGSACRQASGGFKGSNREGLVFELAHTKLILRQVAQAMQEVHGHATLHGDVKPDNFLVSCCYLNKA